MNREKILEIAEFRGIKELICKKCGVVSEVAAAEMVFNGPKVRANCPECGAYIRFLPTRAVWQIFMNQKMGMVEIEKIDNHWLNWALRNRADVKEDLRAAILELIDRRTTDPASFVSPPPDIDTKKEIELMDRIKYLKAEKAAKQAKQKDLIKSIEDGHDYITIQRLIAQIEGISKTVGDYGREILKIEQKLRELNAG